MTAFAVDRREAGQTLAAVVRARTGLSWSKVKELIAAGRVSVQRQRCGEVARRLKSGERIEIQGERPPSGGSWKPQKAKQTDKKKHDLPGGGRSLAIIHIDDDILIVEKPPGVTTVRSAEDAAEFGDRGRKFLPPTLADLLAKRVPGRVIAVHRLDRDTSGLLVFARNAAAAQHLGRQFREHTVEREYLAVVRGRPGAKRIESWLVRDRGDGRRGSGPPGQGERAVTHVRVVRELGPLTLVACRLETGRTHQVRIHLGESGCPLAGERVYDRPVNGRPVADVSGATRIALHAALLGLTHPVTGERLIWESPIPDDIAGIVRRVHLG